MEKYEFLKKIIGKYSSAVIAFSGGVDSTFLAAVAKEVLDNKVLLVTANSSTYPFYELEEAKKLALLLDLNHKIIVSEEIDIPGFSDNPPDRCYYCKKELFTLINHIAQQKKYDVVFDGSNAEDLKDYRPGRKAIKELGVVSPLCEAGLIKKEIRELSGKMNLPTSDKPSYACLASRFPYGECITKEKLENVGKAEKGIRDLGFTQFRLRNHEKLARLEFIPEEINKAWNMRKQLENICKQEGYIYVAIDLKGYRTGAMNETLDSNNANNVTIQP